MERIWKEFSHSTGIFHALEFLKWGQDSFHVSCFLNSNNYKHDPFSRFNSVIALGAASEFTASGKEDFLKLKEFINQTKDWLFGFFSYDLKNQIEELSSNNFDGIQMPLMHFFQPITIVIVQNGLLKIGCITNHGKLSDPEWVFAHFTKTPTQLALPKKSIELLPRVSHKEYLHNVANIKQNIQLGYVYELNYCVEFYARHTCVSPIAVYSKLNAISPTPFSCYYQLDDKFLMSGSPERFLCKRGDKLVSQPIKGTIRRGQNPTEDSFLKEQLRNDPKERSENIMIVDLVRNDLSRSAAKGSVHVEELCGIYSFSLVHQMISTISSRLQPGLHLVDALMRAFPMGSMTGAPKVQAMSLIERYETTQRGLYSGSVGYIDPEGNFDFNVIIRSILYNQSADYVSCMAGSAITIGSEAESEYQECLLKAQAMQNALKSS